MLSCLLELRSIKEKLVQVVWNVLILKITFGSVGEDANPFSQTQSACSTGICAVHMLETALAISLHFPLRKYIPEALKRLMYG